MNWILIIFLHAGMMSHSDDVSITTARFYSQPACQKSGDEITKLAVPTVQNVKFVCVHDEQPK
jgi:hypothetical protein